MAHTVVSRRASAARSPAVCVYMCTFEFIADMLGKYLYRKAQHSYIGTICASLVYAAHGKHHVCLVRVPSTMCVCVEEVIWHIRLI